MCTIGQLHQGKDGLIETRTQVIGPIVRPRWYLTESLMQGIALNLASFSQSCTEYTTAVLR